MENEENRGLIDKKAYEDQLVTFCQFSVGALSHTLGHLDFSWSKKGKEGKRKKRSSRERKDEAATTVFIAGINFHVYFPCYIGMHGIACGSFAVMAWVCQV